MPPEPLATASDKPLRIAQVCPYDIDRPGGVQAHIRDTAAALQRLGHEVTIIAPRVGTAPAAPEALDIRRIGQAAKVRISGTGFEFSLALGQEAQRLRTLMADGGFDVVHYHTVWTPFLPLQALAASRAAAVATFHDTPPEGLFGRIAGAGLSVLSRAILPRFDAAIAVSASPRRRLRPGPGQTIAILPPCTDLKRFSGEAPSAPGGPVRLLFVGRLEPRKGCGLLLEAYRRLRAEGLDVSLSIVGAGPEELALRRFVEAHGLGDVTFAGRVDDAGLPGCYAACDVFCAPSPYGESFGIVVAEAMAAGKPVAAAANAGYSTVLTGEAARFLARPGDADDLHARLRALVLDAPARERLGAWGRSEAMRYDCDAVAPRLAGLYREAILAHGARARRRALSDRRQAALASS